MCDVILMCIDIINDNINDIDRNWYYYIMNDNV